MFEIFSMASTLINFKLTTGSLAGGAGYATSGFVNGIGGPGDKSASITTVNIAQSGQYILSFKYTSGGIVSPLKIDINGINTGTVYKLPSTVGWESSNALTFTLPYTITLITGNNTLKFHGDGISWGPDIGMCSLTLVENKLKINTIDKGSDINKFNFSNGWTDGTNEIWTTNSSATFSFKFKGVSIVLMGIKDPNHGVYQISIDNGAFVDMDAYSSTRTGVIIIFDSGTLSYGDHTLNFKLKGINPHGGRSDGQISYALVDLGPIQVTGNNILVETVVIQNNIVNFNKQWKFNLNDSTIFSNNNYNDSSWRTVDLPHDWSIEFDFNKNSEGGSSAGFLDGGIAWYRKTFKFSQNIQNKKVFIAFDGVYLESSLYVNGVNIGDNQNGFTPFSFDITNALYFDGRNNVVAIRVNNPLPSCRWYSGSGIYRNVRLVIKDYVYVEENGVFVNTPFLESNLSGSGNVNVNIKTKVSNTTNTNVSIKLETTIYFQQNIKVTQYTTPAIVNVGSNIIEQTLIVNKPNLWNVYNGNVYNVIVNIYKDNVLIDSYKTSFGFRYFKFDSNTGFWLNGKNLKIKGVCVHHDLGALGSAINYDAMQRQIKMIKSMGANAIRLTHNPSSPEFIEICENEGMLLVAEAFDCWITAKRKYDYARFFNQYAKRDIQRMVNRFKNSPAIIMWSMGNEIPDTATTNGVTIAKNLISWIKEIDITRPITMGEDKYRGSKIEGDPAWNNNINAVMDVLDLVGYNYSENVYDVHHKAKPNWKMYGSEISSAVRSRDVYLDSTNTLINDKINLQVTSYDQYNPLVYWGRAAEDAWKRDRDRQFIAGSFFWTAFDYIGEPTPYDNSYPSKSSYFGAIDTAGFPKDAYYLYQSQWTNAPMIHILPHWNWKTGDTVRVWVYTNLDTVELFLNNKSLGEKKFLSKTTNYGVNYLEASDGNLHLEWLVPFQSGTLRAVGKRNGVIVVEDKKVTAGNPMYVKLTPEKQTIVLQEKSLLYVIAEIVDANGIVVPTANNLIQFDVMGGTIVGVDNGNAASVERYKDNKRKAFYGKALVIVQCATIPGRVAVKAISVGLQGASTTIITTIK